MCLPAHDKADEIVGGMLAQLLEQSGHVAVPVGIGDPFPDTVQQICKQMTDIVCISALPPFALMKARTLCKRLRAECPDVKILVGIWNFPGAELKTQARLGRALANKVVTKIKEALEICDASSPAATLPPRNGGGRQSSEHLYDTPAASEINSGRERSISWQI